MPSEGSAHPSQHRVEAAKEQHTFRKLTMKSDEENGAIVTQRIGNRPCVQTYVLRFRQIMLRCGKFCETGDDVIRGCV